MSVHIFGIRHHGPGSARAIKKALEGLNPDIILIEGPPEGNSIIKFASHPEMQPPVALLAYVPEEPNRALFYPFADFSPEWQSMLFALKSNTAVGFMDMPLIHKLAFRKANKQESKDEISSNLNSDLVEPHHKNSANRKADAFTYLAEIAGFTDGETWWNQVIEQRINDTDSFSAVMEAMSCLREEKVEKDSREIQIREAWMRKIIRQAEKDGYQKIAVVCGAWHAPALVNLSEKKQDEELIKNLPKVKIRTTWIPWTYDRLTFESGYGAGVLSPGWYDHIFQNPTDMGNLWLTKTARLFRSKNMDISTAHIIEAVRLAECLAALRNLARPGLDEMREATLTVMCFGDLTMLSLVEKELIVGRKIGKVPSDSPQVPLQLDFEQQQKKLRLPSKAEEKIYTLDLRETNDLARSKFLHRLDILGVEWATREETDSRGTFKEQWLLQWQPEMMIRLIDVGIWGNTIENAATAYLTAEAEKTSVIKEISEFLETAILAELPATVEILLQKLQNISSVSSDIAQSMEALPPLASVSRYGNVRKTDTDLILKIVTGLVARICIGLPNSCINIDNDLAEKMYDNITATNESINLMNNIEMQDQWYTSQRHLNFDKSVHGLIAGKACRILTDKKNISDKETSQSFSQALSYGNEPSYTASWLEGFLKNSGSILLLDDQLWTLVDLWMTSLQEEQFQNLLPILRRNFSTFSPAERRKLGEKAKGGSKKPISVSGDNLFDHESASASLELMRAILKLNK